MRVIQLHTARFVVSALIFIGLLANVCVFLAIGALRILVTPPQPRSPRSVVEYREARTVYASAPDGDAFFR
jgi:hypothetical protein